MHIRKGKKEKRKLLDFKPSFWNGSIISTSVSVAMTMAIVRNPADYVLQKVKDTIALYTMFSAVYIYHSLDLTSEFVEDKVSSEGRQEKQYNS